MVWLDVLTESGQGLYFDAWKREMKRQGPSAELISGLVGDGSYEGEVLVELTSNHCEVTFVDRFLDPLALKEFLRRISEDDLVAALRLSLQEARSQEVAELPLFRRDHPQPEQADADHRSGGQVREACSIWHPAVA